MTGTHKDIYLEKVPHITNASPYSIHRVRFLGGGALALYQHWHPDFEICYLEEGELSFYIEERRISLKAGEAVFVPPGLLHRAECPCSGGGVFRAFVFSPDFISAYMGTGQFLKYVQPVLYNNVKFALKLSPSEPWQKEVLTDLERLFEGSDEEDGELFCIGLALVIWRGLYRGHFSREVQSSPDTGLEMRLRESVRYIREHFAEDITLKELADLAHMSEGQFCRSFKQLTGSTPFTYLKKHRIMHSCDYLAGSGRKISEICTLCGFSNISYFNREFRKAMKVTPSTYRKHHRTG